MSDCDPVGVRENFFDHLRTHYLGPASGPEEVIHTRPEHTYLVGTLYPQGPATERHFGDTLGTDEHDEELDHPIEMANNWHPASAAISFLHDAPKLHCVITVGTYEKVPGKKPGHREQWVRRDWRDEVVLHAEHGSQGNKLGLFDDRAKLVCVWRRTGTAWLVTVALENCAEHDQAESPPPAEMCLFQAGFACHVKEGRILPYPSSADLSDDPEDQELRLLYRHRRVYGIGHGCSVDWDGDQDGEIRTVRTDMLPTTIVRGMAPPSGDAEVLRLAHLADESVETGVLCAQLTAFVGEYESWIAVRTKEAAGLEEIHRPAAERLLERMGRAAERMHEGVALLRRDATSLLAFRLANAAMREQMLQTRHVRAHQGVLGAPLAARDTEAKEPSWHHFQLGFQLLSLASTANEGHTDRETVDLIWFPTGGGKTEAYLGLGAFEMIRRRLVNGIRGGGTAILMRYTLRLLTSQQFQRAATLICALERLRETHPALEGTPQFTIGLWVGGETTPNDYRDAFEQFKELLRAQKPDNPFQLLNCPWCGVPVVPRRRQVGVDGGASPAYGIRATKSTFEFFCPHVDCHFHESLPVSVVDEQIFAEPPTLLLATVDKLARLPWVPDAGRVFGRAMPYDAPSLVIQDELHLLSGPLGTTVALYEAAVHALLSWDGSKPKIVASTATIRAADHQVRNLYGSSVELFPPAGLDADDSFFARTDRTSPGRLYVGLMPQAFTQASATILTAVAILQAPSMLGLTGDALDAYWTLVIYHNSLRELGRTVTQVRDDVDAMLHARRIDGNATRSLRGDGVVELTSGVPAEQLPEIIKRLEQGVGQQDVVDVLATTNMLSVGIDIPRLGVMVMNGQPKTTSEYIQATSRVGRSAKVPGLVVTLLRTNKSRDRSHYESFRAYHESLYRYVEPTSVTPWSLASRERSLRAAFVLLVRHGASLRRNEQAGDFSMHDAFVRRALDHLISAVQRADPDEAEASERELRRIAREWHERAEALTERGERLYYRSREHASLLKDFSAQGEGWPTAHSMRSVDRQVRILAVGEGRR
ncbi:helicase-related protein [Amycolatopsis coloradensis]|uniref:Helicase-related protein n=1 Tax=Amycolatopsis coloradensis TaxID=76021 RepID=A0ACD5BA17_9PSEU